MKTAFYKNNFLRSSQFGPVNLPAGQIHVYGLAQVPPCAQMFLGEVLFSCIQRFVTLSKMGASFYPNEPQ